MSERIYPPVLSQPDTPPPAPQTLSLPFVASTAQVFTPGTKRKPRKK